MCFQKGGGKKKEGGEELGSNAAFVGEYSLLCEFNKKTPLDVRYGGFKREERGRGTEAGVFLLGIGGSLRGSR